MLKEHSDIETDQQLCFPGFQHQPHSGRLLRKDFTFDQFVVANNNDFAYSASLSLASGRANQQNALYLLSKTGNGKSHLSQAVGHHILHEFPKEKVYYITFKKSKTIPALWSPEISDAVGSPKREDHQFFFA